MRLFISVNFPSCTADKLTELQDQLRLYGNADYSKRENLHLTLAFIGETDRCNDIISIMEECASSCFDLTIEGTGTFGEDIYYAAVRQDDELMSLASSLRTRLRRAGFDIDDRPFVPHVTLARRAGSLHGAPPHLPPVTTRICHISLMESSRADGKTVYTETARVKLK